MTIHPIIEPTADGSQTLRHPLLGEAYHSLNGAEAESMHVFIRSGFCFCGKEHVRVLEAGFGSGLNAYLTLRAAHDQGRSVEYTAIELYPVGLETVRGMSLADDGLFLRLHESPWGTPGQVAENFSLHKVEADLAGIAFDTTFDVVYFDAFAPDRQPELWSREVFSKIYNALGPGGCLVTYSAKGEVKRALRAAGFGVVRLPGAPGKRHMLRAVKTL